jgi:hypothetical protein
MKNLIGIISIVALSLMTLGVAAAPRKVVAFTTVGTAALALDNTLLSDVDVTSMQINLSGSVTADAPIYVRRMSAAGATMAEYAIDPRAASATAFTVIFAGFKANKTDHITVTWAGDGSHAIIAGSHIMYEIEVQ